MVLGSLAAFFDSTSSSSGLYPNSLIRCSSSLAFLSASSKSMSAAATTFLAPSFDPTFFAPSTFAFFAPVVVFFSAEECVIRPAAGLGASESVLDRGEAARLGPFSPGLRKGDGVRPTTGGVAVREMGGVGFLIEGLSQEEKKSSSGSPAGVDVPSGISPSVITTSDGYLAPVSKMCEIHQGATGTYSWASLAARLFSSSLYLVAAGDWYLVFGSLLFKAAVPPLDWKNLVADSLPPTFMTRS